MIKKLFNFLIKVKNKLKSAVTHKYIIIAAALILVISGGYTAFYCINSSHNLKLNKNLAQHYEKNSKSRASASSDTSTESRYPIGMQPSFYNLYDTNPDIKGWITIPHTVIDYPVVQSTDNVYYLKYNFNKTIDKYGALFLDYRNQVNVQSKNMVIYGHDMKDGQMFHSIVNYQFIDFYKTSSLITFNTIYGNYQWKVFAAFIANADPKDGYVFNYIATDFPSDSSFKSFIKEARARSLINAPSVDVEPGDTILTLSTCYYSLNDARFVVMARRVRPGEDITVPPATRNNNALSATSPMPK